ncbi:MAG: PilZ domain-containing protein [Myxococcales bacterium]|nr:PilZ domain-containing protein [Myxococcales bacterium]
MRTPEVEPNRRILVVDDRQEIHSDFRRLLMPKVESDEFAQLLSLDSNESSPRHHEIRFEVDSALQGPIALQMVQSAVVEERPYAVAFVDMSMSPGWDGLETVQRIWQVDPMLQIVFCAAFFDHSHERLLNELGRMDQFLILQKPFGTAELVQLACSLSERWRLAVETRLKMEDLEKVVAELSCRISRLENSQSELRESAHQPSRHLQEQLRGMSVFSRLQNRGDADISIAPAPRAMFDCRNLASVVLENAGSMAIRDISTSGIGIIVPSKSEKKLIDSETELTIWLTDDSPIHVKGIIRHLADLNDLEACAGFQFLDLGTENYCQIRDYVERELVH